MKRLTTFLTLILPAFLFAQSLIPFHEGNLWAYADETGEIRIRSEYEQAKFFKNGYAVVSKNGRW